MKIMSVAELTGVVTKNKQLTRVYGTHSLNKKELTEYLLLLEAKRRDHRKLGKD
jgi:threonyl-tRNA synthetase